MTETKTTFTELKWSDLGSLGLTPKSRRAIGGWMGQHDLAVEAHEATREFCELSFEDWRALVSATVSGLPITITHRRRGHTTTATYIVEQVMSLRPGTTSNLYVRTWGFAYPLSLGDLVSVEVPPATHEFTREES